MVSKRIRLLRKELGLTQAELGDKLGVIKQTISSWETGVSNPSNEALTAMSKLFGVSVDYLLGMDTTDIDINDEFLKAIEEININDPRAKQIILNYWHLSPANKELFWLLIDKLTKK